jgi:AhpD family alkylhydroperoxidase
MKELMFVAISVDRGCRYCDAAHVACCRMLGVNPAVLEVADATGMEADAMFGSL